MAVKKGTTPLTEATSTKIHIAAFFHAVFIPSCLALHFYLNPSRLQHPSYAGLLVLAVLYYFFLKLLVVPHFTSPLRHVPTPWTESFLWGHRPMSYPRPPGPNLLKHMISVPNEGLIMIKGFLFLGHNLLATTPEVLTEVLSTRAYDYQKPAPSRKFLRRVLGDGLIVVEGAQHKMQRRSVGPAFQPKHIKELVPLFWRKAEQLGDKLSERLSGKDDQGKKTGEVELGSLASRVTLDIIGLAGLGRDFNTLENSEDELAKTYESILDPDKGNLFLYVILNLIFPQWFIRALPWGVNRRIAKAAYNLRFICKRLLAEKRASLEKDAEEGKQIDIIAVLMRSGNLSDDELVDQLLTFLAAGHETTSSALTWVMYLLSTHPSCQTRLREEIKAKIPSGTPVTSALLEDLPYLHAVCAETLRFYPTVPMTVRVATNESRIGDTVVPKGCHIFLCPWAINRNPKLWGDDADTFNPDRWIGEDRQPSLGGAASAYSYLTFLHGPRQCIGHGFAKNELKCLVAAMIGRFAVSMADPEEVIEPGGAITIKPKDGLRLRLVEV